MQPVLDVITIGRSSVDLYGAQVGGPGAFGRESRGGGFDHHAHLEQVAEIGGDRTGIRISPVTPANDAGQDSNAQGLFEYFIERLAPLQLAFVHVIEGATGGPRRYGFIVHGLWPQYEALRRRFKEGNPQGVWIVNNAYTRSMAIEAVAQGRADMVAFGKPFISNPDLVERLRVDAPLAPLNPATLYGGGAAGYTDYPTLADQSRAASAGH